MATSVFAATPPLDTTDRIVVRFREARETALSLERRRDVEKALSARAKVSLKALHTTSGGALVLRLDHRLALADARSLARRLALDASVLSAEPDFVAMPSAVPAQQWPNDSYARAQWPLDLSPRSVGGANFLAAWPWIDPAAPKITVAVIDSGYLPHPDLIANLVPGYDFVTALDTAGDGDARDADPTDPGDWCEREGYASSWHGTSVASVIAAVANNGRGIAGAAPNTSVLALRVLGRCGGYSSDVADAIAWAAGAPVPGVPANATPARIVNLSLGAPHGCPRYMQEAVDAALARNAVVVASAGNDGAARLDSPANCAGVISVGAHTRSGDLAAYSNHAPGMTLTAPGGGVCKAQTSDCDTALAVALGNQGTSLAAGWREELPFTGTSAAVPHVSAALALMLSGRPDLTPAQAAATLASSARQHPLSSWCAQPANAGQCGAGMLDAMNALAQLRAPLVTLTQPRGVVAGAAPVSLAVAAAGGRAPYAIAWRQTSGAPLALDGTDGAELRFVAPPTRQTASFEVVVADSDGFATHATATVAVDNAPTVSASDQRAATGSSLRVPLDARDADGDPLVIDLVDGPEGARIEGGAVVWPRPVSGRHAFTVQASDGLLDSAPASFHVDVQPESASALVARDAEGSGGGALDRAWLVGLAGAVLALGASRRRAVAASAR